MIDCGGRGGINHAAEPPLFMPGVGDANGATGTMRSNRMNGAGWHMLFRGRTANRLARANGWPAPSKPSKATAMLARKRRATKTGIGLNSPTTRPTVRQFRGMISDDEDGAQITPRNRRR